MGAVYDEFVPEMDEEAFPRIGREGPLLRTSRRWVRALRALHHRKTP